MVRLILLRHGYSLFNKERRFSGQYDVDLDEVGVSQAADAAAYILKNYKIDKVYSSDLIRALRTATPVAEALNLPIERSAGLREWNLGEWQGMLIEDVKAKFPDTFETYRANVGISRPDGGENFEEFMDRSEATIGKIAAENEGKTVLVATHGGVIRSLRATWNHIPLEKVKDVEHVPNASLCVAEVENGKGRFIEIGNCSYLKEKTTEKGVH